VLFSLAQDGFLPLSLFGQYSDTGEIEKKSLIISSLMVALIGALFNVDVVIDMVSFATLMNFSVVSACVIIGRLQEGGDQVVVLKGRQASVALCVLTYFGWVVRSYSFFLGLSLLVVSFALACYLCFLCYVTKRNNEKKSGGSARVSGFQCPFVPWIPCAAICLNSRFMGASNMTGILCYIGFFGMGLFVYVVYGYSNSPLRRQSKTVL
jgi:hypothetical protein